jgi:hypothetical protein
MTSIRSSQFLIILVLLLAALLRFAQLPHLPPGLNFDEAGNGVAALDILNGDLKLWWRIGGGKEPLWPYLIAASTALLGAVPLALRLPAAMLGVLTVAAIYPLGRVLFPRQRLLPLLAMTGLALSAWHLHFSRLGFRAVLLPLLSALAFYFFWRAFSRQSSGVASVLLAAVLLAAAVYAYLAARMLPLVVPLFAVLLWFIDRRRSNWTVVFRLLVYLFVFLLPLMVYFAIYPADFAARSAEVSIFNPRWNQGDLAGTAWRVLTISLGTLNGQAGDINPLVNLPGESALPALLAPYFVVGLLVSIYRGVRGDDPAQLFVLCWWAVMLLPALLAPEGAPHHLRLLGAIVPSYLLVALGLVVVIEFGEKPLAGKSAYLRQLWRVLLPATVLTVTGWQTVQHYFVRWPQLDFTLPYDLYAVQLAEDIAAEDDSTGYVLLMDNRAGDEARHYTLDYLLADQPSAYTMLPVDERDVAERLAQAAAGREQLRVVRWTADKQLEADAKEMVAFLLADAGQLAGRESLPVLDVESYALRPDAQFALPTPNQPIDANFDNLLRLDARWLPDTAAPGGSLPVAITLTPLAPMDADYKASLRLVSPDGRRVAQKDRVLLHNFHQGTSLWPPEPVNEYYRLPLPPNAAPGDYTVTVVIYHPDTQAPLVAAGQAEVPLGTVRVE